MCVSVRREWLKLCIWKKQSISGINRTKARLYLVYFEQFQAFNQQTLFSEEMRVTLTPE